MKLLLNTILALVLSTTTALAMTVAWPGGTNDKAMTKFTSGDLGTATIPDAKSVTYKTRAPKGQAIKLTDKGVNQPERLFIILMTEPGGLNSPNDYTVNYKIYHKLMGSKKGSSTNGGINLGNTGNNVKDVPLVSPGGNHMGMIFITGIDITIRNLNDTPDDTIKITKLMFGFEAPDTRQDMDMVTYPTTAPVPGSLLFLTSGGLALLLAARRKNS